MVSKRGLSKTFLYIVLVVVSLLIMVPIISHTIESTKKLYNLRACHDLLIISSRINDKLGAAKINEVPNACGPEGPVEISSEDPTLAAVKIADMMTRCFWSYGEDTWGGFDTPGMGITETGRGFNCFSFKVTDENPEFIITADSLNEWLKENLYEEEPYKKTFFEYLVHSKLLYEPGFIEGMASYITYEDKGKPIVLICDNIVPGNTYSVRYLDFYASEASNANQIQVQSDKVIVAQWNKAQEMKGYDHCKESSET